MGKLAVTVERHTLVLWRWTKQEFDALRETMEAQAKGSAPSPDVYTVSGGSVRCLFKENKDKTHIHNTVKNMEPDEMERLLNLECPTSSGAHKQRTSLLAFYPESRTNISSRMVSLMRKPCPDLTM